MRDLILMRYELRAYRTEIADIHIDLVFSCEWKRILPKSLNGIYLIYFHFFFAFSCKKSWLYTISLKSYFLFQLMIQFGKHHWQRESNSRMIKNFYDFYMSCLENKISLFLKFVVVGIWYQLCNSFEYYLRLQIIDFKVLKAYHGWVLMHCRTTDVLIHFLKELVF